MSIFSTITTDSEAKEFTPSAGKLILDSGIYECTIKRAYSKKAAMSKALNVTLVLDVPGKGEITQVLWISNKEGANFYKTKDGSKNVMPGYSMANAICAFTTQKTLEHIEPEQGSVMEYSYKDSREIPVPCYLMKELWGKQVLLGIVKEEHNNRKNINGTYEAVAETHFENNIDAVFGVESHKSYQEARDNLEAKQYDRWIERNTGKIRDKRTIKDNAGTEGAPVKPEKKATPALFS